MPTEKMKNALETEYCFTIDKVSQLLSDITKYPLQLFQVVLPITEINKEIWTVTNLFYLKISLQKFEIKHGSFVCYN